MVRITERVKVRANVSAILSLSYERRQKSRFRTRLEGGAEVALLLPRGSVLRDGDVLRSECGMLVGVRAAPEAVSTAFSDDHCVLARACYHLGNRHVPLQIAENWVRYLRDHVLDDMVLRLGLVVKQEEAPFEPESGAYGSNHAHHHASPQQVRRHSG